MKRDPPAPTIIDFSGSVLPMPKAGDMLWLVVSPATVVPVGWTRVTPKRWWHRWFPPRWVHYTKVRT